MNIAYRPVLELAKTIGEAAVSTELERFSRGTLVGDGSGSTPSHEDPGRFFLSLDKGCLHVYLRQL